jgi:hypothetical protein
VSKEGQKLRMKCIARPNVATRGTNPRAPFKPNAAHANSSPAVAQVGARPPNPIQNPRAGPRMPVARPTPQFKPVVAQLKTPSQARSIKPPIAPTVFRPPAMPKVQLKMANGAVDRKPPVAPPVYRPQPTPRVLQQKKLHSSDCNHGNAQSGRAGIKESQVCSRHSTPLPFPRGVSGSRAVQLAEREKKRAAPSPERDRSLSPPRRGRAKNEAPASRRGRSRSRGDRADAPAEPAELGRGRRGARPTAKLVESGIDISSGRETVLDRAERRRQSLNEFGSEKKEAPRRRDRSPAAVPPRGMFLMFGLRKELSWAVTSDTNGMKGDEYIYHLARSGTRVNKDSSALPDHRFQDERNEYRCASCKNYFPLQADKRAGDAGHITVDHIPPMSVRLGSARCVATLCDGTNVWEGQLKSRCLDSFNDPKQLQMMCDSHNSSKGGEVGYGRWTPEFRGTHKDRCELGDHADVREIG